MFAQVLQMFDTNCQPYNQEHIQEQMKGQKLGVHPRGMKTKPREQNAARGTTNINQMSLDTTKAAFPP